MATDDIVLDDRDFRRRLVDRRKQIPFAIALALTRTAQAAQANLRGKLSTDFTIRSTFTAKGIRIRPAKKGNLEAGAEVGSIDRRMATQATGGVDVHPSVPTKAVRTTPGARTPPSRWPGKLAKRRRAFFQTVNGKLGLWQRNSKARLPIQLLYVFPDQDKIPERWPFDDRVLTAAAAAWPKEAIAAIKRVLRD